MACGANPKESAHENVSDFIKVSSPQPFEEVSGTLVIKGEAKGTYFFEGDFPVEIVTEDGNSIKYYATAEGDWMQEGFVPFRSEINISNLAPQQVTLKLHKDNPSDRPELDMVMEIPLIIVE